MSKKRANALAGGLLAMLAIAVWAISSGWLANQPAASVVLAVLGWIGLSSLMIVVNVL